MTTAGYREYLFDLLRPLGKIETRKFFGLDGIRADGTLLGFVLEDRLYLRTDEVTRKAYLAESSRPFTFDRSGETVVTAYYTVPERLYDEPEEFEEWARRALLAAREAPSALKRAGKNAAQTSAPRARRKAPAKR
ncbi:MAG: TfoX/Sxy family protein [Alphaproteobacteria bacterium]|nr:TfoX/Sxy family protein [Alphaproteobacteria bacterium]